MLLHGTLVLILGYSLCVFEYLSQWVFFFIFVKNEHHISILESDFTDETYQSKSLVQTSPSRKMVGGISPSQSVVTLVVKFDQLFVFGVFVIISLSGRTSRNVSTEAILGFKGEMLSCHTAGYISLLHCPEIDRGTHTKIGHHTNQSIFNFFHLY